MMIQRRKFYRLQYPKPERPVLFVGDAEFVVLDLSESGARLEKTGEWQREIFPDAGTMFFSEGEEYSGMIHVVRVSEHCFAVSFSPPVAFSRIMSEQRKLWRKYPLKG
ncbi:MAG: PilZ domain-containing protein [Planctomycetaceae bacterium]